MDREANWRIHIIQRKIILKIDGVQFVLVEIADSLAAIHFRKHSVALINLPI